MTENQRKLDAAKQELMATNKLLGRILGEGVVSRAVAIDVIHQIFFNHDVTTYIEKGRVP